MQVTMTAAGIEALIAAVSVILSVLLSVFVSGRVSGRNEARLARVESDVSKLTELGANVMILMRDVAEIKGMFRLELKKGGDDG